MASSAEDLRQRVLELFTDSVEGDAQIAALWETVHSGTQNISYADAYSFAERVGEKLAAAFRAVQGDLPEHIDADFALTILYETLRGDYTLVAMWPRPCSRHSTSRRVWGSRP